MKTAWWTSEGLQGLQGEQKDYKEEGCQEGVKKRGRKEGALQSTDLSVQSEKEVDFVVFLSEKK